MKKIFENQINSQNQIKFENQINSRNQIFLFGRKLFENQMFLHKPCKYKIKFLTGYTDKSSMAQIERGEKAKGEKMEHGAVVEFYLPECGNHTGTYIKTVEKGKRFGLMEIKTTCGVPRITVYVRPEEVKKITVTPDPFTGAPQTTPCSGGEGVTPLKKGQK